MITAEQARTKIENAQFSAAKSQIEGIEKIILNAVESGTFSCLVYSKLNTGVKKYFEDLGYKVREDSGDPREPGYVTTISW